MQHYGCEEKALDAILRGDVADLLSVLSERQAISIAQWARGIKYGVKPEDFLATDESARIYQMIISKIAGCAHTDYARLKIGTLFPTSSPDIVNENRELSKSAIKAAQ